MKANNRVATLSLLTILAVGSAFALSGCGVQDRYSILDGNGTTDLSDICEQSQESKYVSNPIWQKIDCDGDGISNGDEYTNGTDPYGPCDPAQKPGYSDYNASNPIWQAADCDLDNNNNGDDKAPYDACSPDPYAYKCDLDKDGLLNEDEDKNHDHIWNKNSNETDFNNSDTDGDGLSDGEEVNGIDNSTTDANTVGKSNPLDSCDPKRGAGYSYYDNTNPMWQAADCDKDNVSENRYPNGFEDNVSREGGNIPPKISDPYDSNSSCYVFNGKVYCEVIKDLKEIVMDRNLGADQKCSDRDDEHCYGYLYQWGRGNDGAQKREGVDPQDLNPTTYPYVGHDKHEISGNGAHDWMTDGTDGGTSHADERVTFLMSKDGTGICPKGWRVLTEAEVTDIVSDAHITNSQTAFDSDYKLPRAGYRQHDTKLKINSTDGASSPKYAGYFWTSTKSSDGTSSVAVSYDDDTLKYSDSYRATGYSIRCMRDNPAHP